MKTLSTRSPRFKDFIGLIVENCILIQETEMSCGINTISGMSVVYDEYYYRSKDLRSDAGVEAPPLSNPDVIKAIYKEITEQVYNPMVLFSDNTLEKGEPTWAGFAEYVRERKLGTVTMSDSVRNPNSGNDIVVWAWARKE